jgi:hypothetical protein
MTDAPGIGSPLDNAGQRIDRCGATRGRNGWPCAPFFEYARPCFSLVPDRDRAEGARRRAAALVARSRFLGCRLLGWGGLVRGIRPAAQSRRLGAATGAAYRSIMFVDRLAAGEFRSVAEAVRYAGGARCRLCDSVLLGARRRADSRFSRRRLCAKRAGSSSPGRSISCFSRCATSGPI